MINTVVQTNIDFNLSTYLSSRKTILEEALEEEIPATSSETIYQAMRYSLVAGGKRLRPILCLASCELMGGTMEMALPTACALEMIHTMSLIHDDLPAMDNDDYRRGKLTNHKVFGEGVAILAGDALWAYAFELIASKTQQVSASRVVEVIAKIGCAIGARGLIGGQVVDLESEAKSDISLERLNFIHQHKTGALLEISVISGAILAGANKTDIERLSRYAQNIGLAFQIVDDILDITATFEELGKTAQKDLKTQKLTYPSFWGLEESKHRAQQLVDRAKAELKSFDKKAKPLLAIADFIVNRKY